MTAYFRVGRKLGRTVYRVHGNGPEELIGMMDTREWAALVVQALNSSDLHFPRLPETSQRLPGESGELYECPDHPEAPHTCNLRRKAYG